MSNIKDKAVVTQSNKLIEARYHLTVSEQRLIFAIASMIHPDDKDFYTYELSVTDLAYILNMNVSNVYKYLKSITLQLMKKVVEIPEEDGLLQVGWVSSCKLLKNNSIEFRFDPGMKPYLLGLTEQFTQSRVNILKQLQSPNSIRLYLLLNQYRRIGHRTIELDVLKTTLVLEDKYKDFKKFNSSVLNQAKKEFERKGKSGHNLCDFTFELTKIRDGKKINKLKFEIKPLPYQEQLPFDENESYNDDEETSSLITKLESHGIALLRSRAYINKYGVELVSKILAHYLVCLNKGKVKNKNGGLLIYFLENKITGESQYLEAIEKERIENKNALKHIENQKKKDEERKRNSFIEKYEKIYNQMSDIDKKKQQEIFIKSLPRVLVESVEREGLMSDMYKNTFLESIQKNTK